MLFMQKKLINLFVPFQHEFSPITRAINPSPEDPVESCSTPFGGM
jgi:hypothetical protein